MNVDLQGRVAAVTGTGPNIGAGIALALAEAGASVLCLDRDVRNAEWVAEEICTNGGRAVGLACDITDEAQVGATFTAGSGELGTVDVLVNGAAIFNFKGLREMSISEWRQQHAVILDGTFLCTQWVTRTLLEEGRPGAFVNIISTAGHQGEPNNIAYATAKSGLLNFTRSAAVELAPFGIRVNSVTPTATDLSEAAERLERRGLPGPDPGLVAVLARASEQLPLKQLPKPSDYGNAVVFLASDAAAMITGVDLRVDAGAVANYWRR